MKGTLSTAEVSRILGMPEARIRDFVRSGLCSPQRRGRRYAFSFQDVVVLRAARGLVEQRIPAARVRRALSALSAELPANRPLSGMRVYASGDEVAVCDGDAAWNPETGQVLFDFEVDGLARQVEHARAGSVRGTPEAGDDAARARVLFERALELEDDDPKAAAGAYRRAIDLDPELVDACVNLGRISHEAGDASEAARLYHLALERTPDDAIVHFNLALALEDTSGPEAAIAHYERALALDPDFADAHYNVAGLYEQTGRATDALRHYHAYKKLS